MSEFKIYTEEQEQKIARLREEASKPKEKVVINDRPWNRPIKATDRVTVTIDGITTIGYVLSVSKELVKYSKTHNVLVDTFTISTPYGIMKNVPRNKVSLRYYKDLSHIVIPEELKTMSTKWLMSELSSHRSGFYCYDDDEGYHPQFSSKFSEDEIRAELRTRPNIRSKKCNHVVKKHSR